jgi:putative salt-induced outer membrane protein YdiY
VFGKPWFFGIKASAERDPIRELDHRIIIGATSGRDIFNRPRLFLNFQFGLGYLTEEDTLGESQQSATGLWLLRYRQDFFGKNLELYHDDSITYYITGRTNTAVKTSTGLRYDIGDLFYLNTSLDLDYESQPVGDAAPYDLSFLFGLGVEL